MQCSCKCQLYYYNINNVVVNTSFIIMRTSKRWVPGSVSDHKWVDRHRIVKKYIKCTKWVEEVNNYVVSPVPWQCDILSECWDCTPARKCVVSFSNPLAFKWGGEPVWEMWCLLWIGQLRSNRVQIKVALHLVRCIQYETLIKNLPITRK